MKSFFRKTLKILNKIYPLIFSVILIYFLANKLEAYNFVEQVSNIQWQLVFLVLTVFGGIKISNTFRYGYLYGIKEKNKLFWVLCFCNAFLSLLPFRLGEVSYIKYFKDYFGISRSIVARKLILLRFFDLVAVYLLFIISSFYVSSVIRGGVVWYISLFIFIGLIVGSAAFSLIFIFNRKKIFKNNKYYQAIFNFVREVKSEFYSTDKSVIISLFIHSSFYWLLRISLGFLVLRFLGLDLNFFLVAFVSLLLLLIGLFPIKTFADFGIFEGGWAYFLVLVGFNYQDVLPIIINFHILSLLPAIIYGFIGWLMLKFILDK